MEKLVNKTIELLNKDIEERSKDIIELVNETLEYNVDEKLSGERVYFESWQNEANDIIEKLANQVESIAEITNYENKDINSIIENIQLTIESVAEKIDEIDSISYDYEETAIKSTRIDGKTVTKFLADNDLEDVKNDCTTIYETAKALNQLNYYKTFKNNY